MTQDIDDDIKKVRDALNKRIDAIEKRVEGLEIAMVEQGNWSAFVREVCGTPGGVKPIFEAQATAADGTVYKGTAKEEKPKEVKVLQEPFSTNPGKWVTEDYILKSEHEKDCAGFITMLDEKREEIARLKEANNDEGKIEIICRLESQLQEKQRVIDELERQAKLVASKPYKELLELLRVNEATIERLGKENAELKKKTDRLIGENFQLGLQSVSIPRYGEGINKLEYFKLQQQLEEANKLTKRLNEVIDMQASVRAGIEKDLEEANKLINKFREYNFNYPKLEPEKLVEYEVWFAINGEPFINIDKASSVILSPMQIKLILLKHNQVVLKFKKVE